MSLLMLSGVQWSTTSKILITGHLRSVSGRIQTNICLYDSTLCCNIYIWNGWIKAILQQTTTLPHKYFYLSGCVLSQKLVWEGREAARKIPRSDTGRPQGLPWHNLSLYGFVIGIGNESIRFST